MSKSISAQKREAYMAAWPNGRQLEAMGDQIAALTEAVKRLDPAFADAPKFARMQADFAAIKDRLAE